MNAWWQAWLKLVQMEREEAERERKKEEEERRKRKEEAKRKSRILEAAFDGDNDEILTVLEEVKYNSDFSVLFSSCQYYFPASGQHVCLNYSLVLWDERASGHLRCPLIYNKVQCPLICPLIYNKVLYMAG